MLRFVKVAVGVIPSVLDIVTPNAPNVKVGYSKVTLSDIGDVNVTPFTTDS